MRKLFLFMLFFIIQFYMVAFSQIPTAREKRAAYFKNSRDITSAESDFEYYPLQTENQLKYDVLFYDLYFDIKLDDEIIYGKTYIKAKALSEISIIELNLSTFMVVDSVRIGNIPALNTTHFHNLVTISSLHPVKKDSIFNVAVFYHGAPSSSGFGSFEWNSSRIPGYKIFWTLSEPYGAKDWWPSKNTPKDKADSVYIHVKVPDGYMVASNGVLKEEIDLGDTTEYLWIHRYPIATYLVAITGAPFVEIDDIYDSGSGWTMPMQHFIYPSWDSEETRSNLGAVKNMISAFNFYFGNYPFKNEKYGIAQFGWGGGMEHQTMTYQGSFYTNLCSHELAHQWFGDNVTCADFHHIWLNEGFASIAEALYQEWVNGPEAYQSYVLSNFYYYSLDYTKPIYVADVDENNPDHVANIFSSIVYKKGAFVLHMLRRMINNDDQFKELLKEWNSPTLGYGHSSATTEDFSRFVSDFLGEDYSWFFNDWIYLPYHPVYEVVWENLNNGATSVKIKQLQETSSQGFYRMKIPLYLENSTRDTTIVVFNDTQDQIFLLNPGFSPGKLEFDPEFSVLKEVEGIYQHINGINPEGYMLLGNYPNPFNPGTSIKYFNSILSDVKVDIYNSAGQKIRLLSKKGVSAGTNILYWDGNLQNGNPAPSGVYFYQITFQKNRFESTTKSGKMSLIR